MLTPSKCSSLVLSASFSWLGYSWALSLPGSPHSNNSSLSDKMLYKNDNLDPLAEFPAVVGPLESWPNLPPTKGDVAWDPWVPAPLPPFQDELEWELWPEMPSLEGKVPPQWEEDGDSLSDSSQGDFDPGIE